MEQLTIEKIISHLFYYLILYVVGLAAIIGFYFFCVQMHSDIPFGAAVFINVLYFSPVMILGALVATFRHDRLSIRTYRRILFISVLPIVFSWPVLIDWSGEAVYSRFIVLWFIVFVVIRLAVVTWDNRDSSSNLFGSRQMLYAAGIGLLLFALLVITSLIPVQIGFGFAAVLAGWWCIWKAWQFQKFARH